MKSFCDSDILRWLDKADWVVIQRNQSGSVCRIKYVDSKKVLRYVRGMNLWECARNAMNDYGFTREEREKDE